MEAPKALHGVESGRGVENAFWHTFWSQNTIFSVFFKFSAFGQRGALAFRGGRAPLPLGYEPDGLAMH